MPLPQNILQFLTGGQNQEPDTAQSILSGRFQPSLEDAGRAAYQGFVTGKPVVAQDFADNRMSDTMKRMEEVEQMRNQRAQVQMAQDQFAYRKQTDARDYALKERQFAESQRNARVNQSLKQAVPHNRKLTATEQKELFDTTDMISAATGAKSALERASSILKPQDGEPAPYTGFGADIRTAAARVPYLGNIIADKDRAAATTEYSTLVTEQALNNLKAIFGGMPTEGERQVLMQMQALSTYTPEEQDRIIANAVAAADKRLSFNRSKASAIQTGDYSTLTQMPTDTGNEPAPAGSMNVFTTQPVNLQPQGWSIKQVP